MLSGPRGEAEEERASDRTKEVKARAIASTGRQEREKEKRSQRQQQQQRHPLRRRIECLSSFTLAIAPKRKLLFDWLVALFFLKYHL